MSTAKRRPKYKFYTLARLTSLLLNVDITILYPNTQTLTVYIATQIDLLHNDTCCST